MKYLLIAFVLITTTSVAQNFTISTFQDSTIVKGANLAMDPFQLGDNPLANLKKYKSKITKEPIKNLHIENKIDTLYRFTIKKDYFVVYKVDEQKNFLVTATVRSKKFKTDQGFKTGMKKMQVEKILARYNVKTIPDCLVFENEEVYQVVILRFKKKKLVKIEFVGYLD
jgi:hypothetical protein